MNTRPMTLKPLTPEQALRHAMQVPPPDHDPKPPKKKPKSKKKPAAKKSKTQR